MSEATEVPTTPGETLSDPEHPDNPAEELEPGPVGDPSDPVEPVEDPAPADEPSEDDGA